MNVEMIEIVLLGTVGILQFIHYANIGVIIAYAHQTDDSSNKQYDQWDSATVKVSYMSAYVIITATLSLFAIGYLCTMKFLKRKIIPIIQTLLLLALAMFQWTIGILIAIYTSELTSPVGSHKDSAPNSDKYDTEWRTDVANTILTFLFNIPITIALLLRAIKALSDGRGTLPGAPSSFTDRPPSITRESPQLRETLATQQVEQSRAHHPQPTLYSNPPAQNHHNPTNQQPPQNQYPSVSPDQHVKQQPNPYTGSGESNPPASTGTAQPPMPRDTFRSSMDNSPPN